jgi:hypothetical protein
MGKQGNEQVSGSKEWESWFVTDDWTWQSRSDIISLTVYEIKVALLYEEKMLHPAGL